MTVNPKREVGTSGLFDGPHTAFIESVASLRPKLHRYCARMTGSALDGEDVMQDAIFEAYRKFHLFDQTRPLAPWLFRIAHNRCVDFLRRREARREAEIAVQYSTLADQVEPLSQSVDCAIERLVFALPPKERSCILLKEIFDYSNQEIAALVGSTVGGVKAALHRGRGKLATLSHVPRVARAASDDEVTLLRLYVERFNEHDWDGVRELAAADARLRVADCFAGHLADSPYFIEYDRPLIPWRMALGEVDGETVIIILHGGAGLTPYSAIRIGVAGGRVVSIDDYIKCDWILGAADVVIRD